MAANETPGVPSDSGWHPGLEDGVQSVDGDPDDCITESESAPESEGLQRRGETRYPTQCCSVDCNKERVCLDRKNREYRNEIRTLKAKVRGLELELERRNKEPGKQTKRTWPSRLRDAQDDDSYSEIFKLSCYEENANPKKIHPALVFKRSPPLLVSRHVHLAADRARRQVECANVLEDLVLNPAKPRRFLEYQRKYSFCDLPVFAQRRIFQLLFSFPGKLIHAISRLDQFQRPETVPLDCDKRSGLLNRFHITGMEHGRSCYLTYALKGNDLLAPFLVSRQFLFLGAHAFYGCNTFAFSSLGKFGRFSRGIGAARRQRLQHIELVWVGSQIITMEGHSRRTWALASLCEMPRLQTLTIYIDDSLVRRKYEGIAPMSYLATKTSGRPDFRMKRNLRTVQGIDYVRQIRGLQVLRVLDHRTCQPIRDWSFVLDLETTCRREKQYDQHKNSKIERLLPLCQPFSPSSWEWDAVKSHYNMTTWKPQKGPEGHVLDADVTTAPAARTMAANSMLDSDEYGGTPSLVQDALGGSGVSSGRIPGGCIIDARGVAYSSRVEGGSRAGPSSQKPPLPNRVPPGGRTARLTTVNNAHDVPQVVTHGEEGLFVLGPTMEILSNSDTNRVDNPMPGHFNQTPDLVFEFSESPVTRPALESGISNDPEHHHGQSSITESRAEGTSVDERSSFSLGVELKFDEKEFFKGETAGGQEEDGEGDMGLEPFIMRQPRGTKRLPSQRLSSQTPAQGMKRLPSQGFKHPFSQKHPRLGMKGLPPLDYNDGEEGELEYNTTDEEIEDGSLDRSSEGSSYGDEATGKSREDSVGNSNQDAAVDDSDDETGSAANKQTQRDNLSGNCSMSGGSPIGAEKARVDTTPWGVDECNTPANEFEGVSSPPEVCISKNTASGVEQSGTPGPYQVHESPPFAPKAQKKRLGPELSSDQKRFRDA